jgi:hypothetical protein
MTAMETDASTGTETTTTETPTTTTMDVAHRVRARDATRWTRRARGRGSVTTDDDLEDERLTV